MVKSNIQPSGISSTRNNYKVYLVKFDRSRRGRDDMVVGFTTNCAISVYHY